MLFGMIASVHECDAADYRAANPMPVTTVTGATEIDVLRKGCRRQALA
jgi:hypothetical protein